MRVGVIPFPFKEALIYVLFKNPLMDPTILGVTNLPFWGVVD